MMSAVFSLATLALASAAPQLPAGLTIQDCVNYPYCDQVYVYSLKESKVFLFKVFPV